MEFRILHRERIVDGERAEGTTILEIFTEEDGAARTDCRTDEKGVEELKIVLLMQRHCLKKIFWGSSFDIGKKHVLPYNHFGFYWL